MRPIDLHLGGVELLGQYRAAPLVATNLHSPLQQGDDALPFRRVRQAHQLRPANAERSQRRFDRHRRRITFGNQPALVGKGPLDRRKALQPRRCCLVEHKIVDQHLGIRSQTKLHAVAEDDRDLGTRPCRDRIVGKNVVAQTQRALLVVAKHGRRSDQRVYLTGGLSGNRIATRVLFGREQFAEPVVKTRQPRVAHKNSVPPFCPCRSFHFCCCRRCRLLVCLLHACHLAQKRNGLCNAPCAVACMFLTPDLSPRLRLAQGAPIRKLNFTNRFFRERSLPATEQTCYAGTRFERARSLSLSLLCEPCLLLSKQGESSTALRKERA